MEFCYNSFFLHILPLKINTHYTEPYISKRESFVIPIPGYNYNMAKYRHFLITRLCIQCLFQLAQGKDS